MLYWLKKLITRDVENWYVMIYKEREYVIKIVKGMSLDIQVSLIDDVMGDVQSFVIYRKAMIMNEKNLHYPHVKNIIDNKEEER